MARGKESRTLFDAIKGDIDRSSGGNFADFFGLRESGAKCRVRFLDDFEDGLAVVFHDKWNGFNHPCLKQYNKKCPNCNNPEGRTGSVYYWNVYNYETKKVELFGYKANRASPIPALLAVFEAIGDLTAQDLIIQRNGSGTSTSYTVIPTGKEVDFNKSVKKFTERKILKLLFDTFQNYGDEEDDEEYDEDDDTTTTKRKPKSKPKSKPKYEEEDDEEDYDDYEDDDFDDDEDEEEEPPRKSKSKPKPKTSKPTKSKRRYEEEEDEEDDDEPPFDDDEEDDEDELPPPRRKKTTKRR